VGGERRRKSKRVKKKKKKKKKSEKREEIPMIIPTVTKVRRPKTILMEGAMDFKINTTTITNRF